MLKRSRVVVLGPVMAAVLAGCGSGSSSGDEWEEMCQDRVTQWRLADEECDDDDGDGRWVYVPHGAHQPAVGSKTRITGGTTTRPGGSIARVPAAGGFGTHAGTSGT